MKRLNLTVLIMLFLFADLNAEVKVTGPTVIDTGKGLEWQNEEPGKMRWMDGVNYCKRLSLDGKADWRLPNKDELESCFKISKHFSGVKLVFYWSSTDYEPNKEFAWLVDLSHGFLAYDNGGYSYSVKCVRTLKK